MQNWRVRYDAIMADTEDDATGKGAQLRTLGAALRAAPAGDPAFTELIAISLLTVESDRLSTSQDSSAAPPSRTR